MIGAGNRMEPQVTYRNPRALMSACDGTTSSMIHASLLIGSRGAPMLPPLGQQAHTNGSSGTITPRMSIKSSGGSRGEIVNHPLPRLMRKSRKAGTGTSLGDYGTSRIRLSLESRSLRKSRRFSYHWSSRRLSVCLNTRFSGSEPTRLMQSQDSASGYGCGQSSCGSAKKKMSWTQ